MKIAEILEAEDGTTIPSVTAELKKLFEASEGESKYKAGETYTKQGGYLKDGEDEIRVTFWFEVDADMEGKTITIRSVKNKKGKMGGVILKLDPDGKYDPQLSVSSLAKIEVVGEDTQDESEPELPIEEEEERPKKAVKPAKATKQPDEIPGAESPKANVRDAAEAIERFAGLYELCIIRATATIPWFKEQFDDDMTPDQFQAYVSSLFISARDGGYAKKLPRKAASYLVKKPEAE